ncbi:acyltransferase family protein [Sinomonas humi]|uniref:Acyltransferase 3 domain-containing protein n=1 Tax=Sinomonas humi TaxID=1338436 RepID=A0A0B2AL89_9MICC|nr:acyltransferase [Sinomonas humi]KHL02542.1 hypothetical protein LK10_11920 [Sinomonas humi]
MAYVPALDGLRAVAVTLVLMAHIIGDDWHGGMLGVDIFFVLSGFLITRILLRSLEATDTIRLGRFYLRRLVRLYPALLASLAIFAVPGLMFAPLARYFVLENVFALSYTTPFFMEAGWNVSKAWSHTWSLGVEELFYLAWPAALLIWRNTLLWSKAPAVLAAIAGAMLTVNVVVDSLDYRASWFLRAGGLLLGCALAIAQNRGSLLRVPVQGAICGTALLIAGFGWASSSPTNEVGGPALLGAFGAVLFIGHVGSAESGPLVGLLGCAPLVFLGTISYELYLVHYPLVIIVEWAFGWDAPLPWLAGVSVVLVSVLLAALVHRVLARSVENWKARFAS